MNGTPVAVLTYEKEKDFWFVSNGISTKFVLEKGRTQSRNECTE